tara:strand:- start:371 stop:952 length:582 start_codon:yes stop_codon:yes gene_type:complete
MKNVSPLKNIIIEGQYGNFENKKDSQIIKIKEIKNLFIYQVVKFKTSKKNNNDLKVDNLTFPDVLKVNSNTDTRILWMGPNNWLVISLKSLNNELNQIFSNNEFAVTDISHSRSIIELEGENVKEVIKKGSPFNIEEMKDNSCSNTIYNGVTITIDNIDQEFYKIRVISLRSFGESLYHSIADACLEFGYNSH